MPILKLLVTCSKIFLSIVTLSILQVSLIFSSSDLERDNYGKCTYTPTPNLFDLLLCKFDGAQLKVTPLFGSVLSIIDCCLQEMIIHHWRLYVTVVVRCVNVHQATRLLSNLITRATHFAEVHMKLESSSKLALSLSLSLSLSLCV